MVRPGRLSPALLVLLGAAAPQAELPALPGEVAVDGRLAAAEWTGAREVQADGMRVRLGRRGEAVAVAVELPANGISSLFLASGDRVWVLHASAALGTGEYRCASGGLCTRTRDFEYRCRDPSAAPAAEQCRSEFRAREGWIASVEPTGSRTREFLLDPRRFGAEGTPLFLAVTGLTLPEKAARWPAAKDAAGAVRLQQGFLPEEARFSPRSWFGLRR